MNILSFSPTDCSDNVGTTRSALPWPEQYAIQHNWTQTNTVRDQKFDSCRSLSFQCELFKPNNDLYSCAWFWDRSDIYNAKVGYWILRVIEGVNHKLKLFNDNLTQDILYNHLKLGKINEDFDPPSSEEDPAWKWYALTMCLTQESRCHD